MKIEKQELLDFENLLKAIKRAKFNEFLGQEALALARIYVMIEQAIEEFKKNDNSI
jgi:hypothetical protein